MSKFICDDCGAPTDNEKIVCGIITVHRCDECEKIFRQELAWESEGETLDEDCVTCPYCGYKYDFMDSYDFDEGKTEEVECAACSRKFDVEVQVKRTYSTKRSLCEMPENYGEEVEE